MNCQSVCQFFYLSPFGHHDGKIYYTILGFILFTYLEFLQNAFEFSFLHIDFLAFHNFVLERI